MMETRDLLQISVAQILLLNGWKKTTEYSLCALVTVLERFLERFARNLLISSNINGRGFVTIYDIFANLDDIGMSFQDIIKNINLNEEITFVYPSLPEYPIDLPSEIIPKVNASNFFPLYCPKSENITTAPEPMTATLVEVENIPEPVKLKISFKEPEKNGLKLTFQKPPELLNCSVQNKSTSQTDTSDKSTETDTESEKQIEPALTEHDGYMDIKCILCISGVLLPSGDMICCDKCDVWYHCFCCGTTLKEVEKLPLWFCHLCDEKKQSRKRALE